MSATELGLKLERYKRSLKLEEWVTKPHPVLYLGEVVSEVEIHPVARKLVLAYQLHVYINGSASEPRWEAQGCGEIAFEDNPNLVIMDCVRKIRRANMAKGVG